MCNCHFVGIAVIDKPQRTRKQSKEYKQVQRDQSEACSIHPRTINETCQRAKERGGQEDLSACGFHCSLLFLFDWFGHFTFSMSPGFRHYANTTRWRGRPLYNFNIVQRGSSVKGPYRMPRYRGKKQGQEVDTGRIPFSRLFPSHPHCWWPCFFISGAESLPFERCYQSEKS